VITPFGACLALVAASIAPIAVATSAGAQSAGPAEGVAYGARKGDAQVRLVGLGQSPDGEELVLLDVKLECEGFEPQGRLVGVIEDGGRFEVEGPVSDPGTTDVITGEFDDIDGRVRSDGAVLEIDVEVEGEDNAGSTGRCEETQQWRLRPRPSEDAGRIVGAAPTDASELASNDDALFTLVTGDEGGAELARVDPATLETTWTVDASPDATLVAAAGDAVWVLDRQTLELARIGALSGDVDATIPLESAERAADLGVLSAVMVATPTATWVGIDETESVYRVDAATNEVTVASVGGRIDALGAGADGVYASTVAEAGGDAVLVHLDEQGSVVASVGIEDLPSGIALVDGQVWTRSTDRLAAYDASTLAPVGDTSGPRFATGSAELLLAVGADGWAPTTRGLEAFAPDFVRTVDVPVVGADAASLAAAEGSVFVIDSGHLIEIEAG
jgi:hypothetical protein